MISKSDDRKSSFRLLWGTVEFTTEPLWYRLVVIVLLLIALVVVVFILKEWVTVPVASNYLSKLKDGAVHLIQSARSK